MNGNYYVTKLKIKLKEEKYFLWLIGVIVFIINLDLSWNFFAMRKGQDVLTIIYDLEAFHMFFKDKRPAIGSSEGTFYLMVYYYAISIYASKRIAKWAFEFFMKSKTFAPKKLLEEDIAVPNFPYDQDKLQLIIGLKHKESKLDLVESPKWITIPQKGLHQDILICGGKGTGKTQSCMYPFTKQMIYYKAYSPIDKAGMLILDVKGNYTKEALKCAQEVNRDSDVIVMNLSGKYKYNPLYKPSLRPQVISNRLRTVLELFSSQHADSYWLDKAEVLITQAIKLARLYNKGEYLTFVDIHKIVNMDDFLNDKIEYLQELEDRNKLTRAQKANFRTVKDYFLNEYKNLDTKVSSVIKSEVTRMTQTFIDDPDILNTFCSSEQELNFFGFDDLVDTGKVVVLDMNISEFRNLSKIIAAYLKLDFQSAALIRLTRESANTTRPLVFISDEYQEYVTANDADFYALSREAKCISIVSTQSYSSLLKTLKSEEVLQTILTNLTNKIWLKTDDKKTAEAAVSQCGTVKKKEVNKTYGKSGGKNYSNFLGRNVPGGGGGGTSYNESFSINVKSTNKFDVETFTIELPTFKCVAYLSDGDKIIPPTVIHLEPYFKDNYSNLGKRAKPALNDTRNAIKSAALRADEKIEEPDDIEDDFDFVNNSVAGQQMTKNKKSEETFLFDDEDDNDNDFSWENAKVDDIVFEDTELEGKDDLSNPFGELDLVEDSSTDDFFDDIDFEPKKNIESKPKNSSDKTSSSSSSSTKYIDKETEEKLKKIEGVFDEE